MRGKQPGAATGGRNRKRAPNPGRTLFRGVTRKREPVRLESLSDLQVLRVLFTEAQAASILEKCGPAGLANFSALGDGGPRALLDLPGIDEGGAARLLAVFELAVRMG